MIEADLTKCFDRIPHGKLLQVLARHIHCAKTLALIKSGLKAGYIHLGNITKDELVGTPQGSVLSPLLCNVYLHELDAFMADLTALHTKGTSRRKNPAYRKIQYELSKARASTNFKSQGAKEAAIRQLRRELWKVSAKDPMDPNFRRLTYVRYADDFVIGLIGPRQLAVDIKNQVETFIKERLNLELNQEKTLITPFSKGIRFLGAIITRGGRAAPPPKEKPITTLGKKRKGIISRVTPRLSFHAPIRTLLDRLVLRGYARWSRSANRIIATALRDMVNQDHRTILQLYNSVIRGLMEYYSFADNRKSLGTVVHLLKWSCALTLALKYKLRTASKTFKKFGSRLVDPDSKHALYIPETFRRLTHLEPATRITLSTPQPPLSSVPTPIR